MKKRILLFGSLILLTFLSIVLAAPTILAAFKAPLLDPIIASLIAQVDSATVRQYTGDLSGEWPVQIGGEAYTISSRNTYSGESIHKATQFVAEHFTALGLEVTAHNWLIDGPPNIIGEITSPTAEDIYLITAHLDNMPSGSIAPGADDNASGSVAVLIAADLLSQYQWDCTLRFVLFTGEEQGLLGSKVYAAQAAAAGEPIRGVLNLDMIAFNSDTNPEIDLHARSAIPTSVTMAEDFATVIDIYDIPLQADILVDDGVGNFSDNKSFWDQNIPAILAIEDNDDFNDYYHTTADSLENIDIEYFTAFVQAAVGSFAHMSACLIPEQTAVYGYDIVNAYPHDTAAFTQGLIYTDGVLYEGTGLYGQSSLRRVELATGTVLQQHDLDTEYFGEGITSFNDELIQLTWREQTGFVYDQATFAQLDTFSYPTQGWGLTHDGTHLIMSDGSDNLYFLNPETYTEIGRVSVHDQGVPIDKLNELEYINGEIFANIWLTNRIARIDPQTGRVNSWVDLTGLLTPTEAEDADVLNGIAYDDSGDRLFVTGKFWPKLFEITLAAPYQTMIPVIFNN